MCCGQPFRGVLRKGDISPPPEKFGDVPLPQEKLERAGTFLPFFIFKKGFF